MSTQAEISKHAKAEIEWYRSNGRHSDRITVDNIGCPYVVGDWSWNLSHSDRQECIESQMKLAVNLKR